MDSPPHRYRQTLARYPPFDEQAYAARPTAMSKADFLTHFGGIFEESEWVAEAAYALELGPAHNSAEGMHNALCRIFRKAGPDKQLEVLRAHPDLAGRLAQQGQLTKQHQRTTSAGLDALTPQEMQQFTDLNASYTKKFGFPLSSRLKGWIKLIFYRRFKCGLNRIRIQNSQKPAVRLKRLHFYACVINYSERHHLNNH